MSLVISFFGDLGFGMVYGGEREDGSFLGGVVFLVFCMVFGL